MGETWKVSRLERIQVPTLVRQVIEARLERLGTESRRLLEVAAVIGHEVDLDLWVEVSEVDEDTLVSILEQALEARLVEGTPQVARAYALRMRWCAGRFTRASSPPPEARLASDHWRPACKSA